MDAKAKPENNNTLKYSEKGFNMKAPTSDLVRLSFDNLFGTQGTLDYVEYHLEFSGRFNESGKPILVRQQKKESVPLLRPHPGQLFSGTWVPHEPLPFVVIDTPTLKLAFQYDGESFGQFSLTKPPTLEVEALEVLDSVHGRKAVWGVFERLGEGTRRALNPAVTELALPVASYISTLTVPREDAVKYLGEEIELMKKQRAALNPTLEHELSYEAAFALVAPEVLGVEYRKTQSEVAQTLNVTASRL